ncbi:MAG: pyrrolysine--tRNA(Pyl) ligase large subunit, partial [Desulfobacteraceae bacterium]|nr:pyrrolysine--tRNA(Pyl) ligase large subunit [Desulfobacteraceae bacterium]
VRRFKELGVDVKSLPDQFPTAKERNQFFQKFEKQQVKSQRAALSDILGKGKKSHIEVLKGNLVKALSQEGFTRVFTPTIISKSALKKMTVDENHPLSKQVFWINGKKCLRPMLAPNLYSLMIDFGRLPQRPIRFFEMGSCFRKESEGARHASEFTMLNLVEMGQPKEERNERLNALAKIILKAAGIEDYQFETEDSKVYGTTLDVVAGPQKIEVASGAMGPHPLDAAWGITDTWVGMGFGIERLLMISQKDAAIGKWVKSISYFDGLCLSL